jgi:hypothetical protein
MVTNTTNHRTSNRPSGNQPKQIRKHNDKSRQKSSWALEFTPVVSWGRVNREPNSGRYSSGAGTSYPSGVPVFTPCFQWCSCYSIFSFMCFLDRCLSFCTFSFSHCVVCPSSIYGYFKSRQICLNICDPNIHIDMVINNLLTKCYNDIWSDTGTMTCLVIYRCYDISP